MLIEELPAERVDDVEPLWSALREHHGEVGKIDLPVRAREESWALRRRQYEAWLAGDGFAFVARREGVAIGYAMVNVIGPGPTLVTGARTGDVETLSVLPEARGAGVGSALLDAVEERLAELGIVDVVIAVMEGNEHARRLYESRGFKAFTTVLTKRL